MRMARLLRVTFNIVPLAAEIAAGSRLIQWLAPALIRSPDRLLIHTTSLQTPTGGRWQARDVGCQPVLGGGEPAVVSSPTGSVAGEDS